MLARIHDAIVDVYLAIQTGIAGLTRASIFVQFVDAQTTVLARIRIAFVDVDVATFTCREQIGKMITTTRTHFLRTYISLVLTTVAGRTMTYELVHAVFATAAV